MFLVVKKPKTMIFDGHEDENSFVEFQRPQFPINDLDAAANRLAHTVYQTETEKQASDLAGLILRESPKNEIFVCEVRLIIQATTPEILTKQVTKEGVLPV